MGRDGLFLLGMQRSLVGRGWRRRILISGLVVSGARGPMMGMMDLGSWSSYWDGDESRGSGTESIEDE